MLAAALFAMIAVTPPAGMVKIPAGAYVPVYGEPVQVAAFALDRMPVTRAEFQSVAGEDGRRPAVGITWLEAKQYCEARGKRLPTTAEWERAASATPIPEQMSLYAMRRFGPNAGLVGRGERNQFGVADLHGLVWEWTLDFGSVAVGQESSADPRFGCGGSALAAADPRDYAAFMRSAFRGSLKAQYALETLGFRCAKEGT